MKTIGFQDIAGGSIHCYFNRANPDQKRHDRIKEALNDLRHVGRIRVYLIDGKKIRKLFTKLY